MPIEYQTLQQVVMERLRLDIINGVFQPGQRLIADDIAREYSVSRMPVREALMNLEAVGLVTGSRHKGVTVNQTSAEDFGTLYEIRAVLEGLAGRLACPNLSEENILKLKELNQDMRVLEPSTLDRKFQELNREFHAIIWKATKSNRLINILNNLHAVSSFYRNLTVHLPGRIEEICNEHEETIVAFSCKDAVKAEEAIKKHYLKTKLWLLKSNHPALTTVQQENPTKIS